MPATGSVHEQGVLLCGAPHYASCMLLLYDLPDVLHPLLTCLSHRTPPVHRFDSMVQVGCCRECNTREAICVERALTLPRAWHRSDLYKQKTCQVRHVNIGH